MAEYTDTVQLARNGWSVLHAPAANTQATATKAAAGAGRRHICTGILATFNAATTAPAAIQVTVVVRDGASGTGTIIWTGTMSLTAVGGNSSAPIQLDELYLLGSPNTAMTIEFTAAGGANTVEAVSMMGLTASDV